MPKLTTKTEILHLLRTIEATKLKHDANGQALPHTSSTALYQALGLLPITTTGGYKIFDKKTVRADYASSENPQDGATEQNHAAEIDTFISSLADNRTWQAYFTRGILQQQSMVHHRRRAGVEGRLQAMESFFWSHVEQQKSPEAKQLAPYALYHLSLLLKNERNANLLSSPKIQSKITKLFGDMAHNKSPLNPKIKELIKNARDTQKGGLPSLLMNIGEALEREAYYYGHLIAAITAGQTQRGLGETMGAAECFAYAYEIAPHHSVPEAGGDDNAAILNAGVEQIKAAAKTALIGMKTPGATLQRLAVEVRKGEHDEALAALSQEYGESNISENFAELVDTLIQLESRWEQAEPATKQTKVDFWAQVLFSFAQTHLHRFNNPRSLADLATLFHLASESVQGEFVEALPGLVNAISTQTKTRSEADLIAAGQGVIDVIALYTTHEPIKTKVMAPVIEQQFIANAVDRLLARVGDKTYASKGAPHAIVNQPLATKLESPLLDNLPTKNRETQDATYRESAARAVALLFQRAIKEQAQKHLKAGASLDTLSVETIVDAAIREQKNSICEQLDTIYNPGRRKATSKTSKAHFEKVFAVTQQASSVSASAPDFNAKQTIISYVKEAIAQIKQYNMDPPKQREHQKTIAGQIQLAKNDAQKNAFVAFMNQCLGMKTTLERATTPSAVFQGAAEKMASIFKNAVASGLTEHRDTLTQLLETLVIEFQKNIEQLNTPKTFLAIAELLITFNQVDRGRATKLAAQLLKAIRAEHVPSYETLSTKDFSTLTHLASIAYLVNKRGTDAYRSIVGVWAADAIDAARTAGSETPNNSLGLTDWVDDVKITEFRAAHAKREATKANSRKEENQNSAEAQAESAQAYEAYLTCFESLSTEVTEKMMEADYEESLANLPDNPRMFVDSSLLVITDQIAKMARTHLPLPEDDAAELEIQELMRRIKGTEKQAAEDIDRLDCGAIRGSLLAQENAERLVFKQRKALRQSLESSHGAEAEKAKLAEAIVQVQQFKKAAEFPIRQFVYEQHGIPVELAEQMYPPVAELPESFQATARDMMKTPGLTTDHHRSASFNAMATTNTNPPASLQKIWAAFLFMPRAKLYGEQLLQGGIIDKQILDLLEANLNPAIRLTMLSLLTSSLSEHSQSEDIEDMLKTWLLTTAIMHVTGEQDEKGKTMLQTLSEADASNSSTGRHVLAKDKNFTPLVGTAPYKKLEEIAKNLWGRLSLHIPPIVVRSNLDRIYEKQLKQQYKSCQTAASNLAKSNNDTIITELQAIQELARPGDSASAREPATAETFAPIPIKKIKDTPWAFRPDQLTTILSNLLLMLEKLETGQETKALIRPKVTELQKIVKNQAQTRDTKITKIREIAQTLANELRGETFHEIKNLIKAVATLYLSKTAALGERTIFENSLPTPLIQTLVALGKPLMVEQALQAQQDAQKFATTREILKASISAALAIEDEEEYSSGSESWDESESEEEEAAGNDGQPALRSVTFAANTAFYGSADSASRQVAAEEAVSSRSPSPSIIGQSDA